MAAQLVEWVVRAYRQSKVMGLADGWPEAPAAASKWGIDERHQQVTELLMADVAEGADGCGTGDRGNRPPAGLDRERDLDPQWGVQNPRRAVPGTGGRGPGRGVAAGPRRVARSRIPAPLEVCHADPGRRSWAVR